MSGVGEFPVRDCRERLRMARRRSASTLLLLVSACATAGQALQTQYRDVSRAVFLNGSDRIVLDVDQDILEIGGRTFPLEDCSTLAFHCYRNVALGVHLTFPRSCGRIAEDSAQTAGGYDFYIFRGAPHGDVRDGSYVSDLSHRYLYRYWIMRGLFAIDYDKSGNVMFGPRDNGGSLNSSEAAPYTYELEEGRSFLRCR